MNVQELHLEMTRNCTLYCEHCLRGEKECKNICFDTIDNIFMEVNYVYNLLLTGGEPLIAISQLEYLIEVIKKRNVRIGKITLVTNGTVMSSRVLKALKELARITYLRIDISGDIFHKLELERLSLLELRNKNFKILHDLFVSEEYSIEYEKKTSYLSCVGRAELLSQDRLRDINGMIEGEYLIQPGLRTMSQPKFFIQENSIFGYVPVDIYGNIVSYGQSFKEEDEQAERVNTNINQLGFKRALNNFIDYTNNQDIIAARVPAKR